jgi:chromosome segregation ATPase
MRRVTMVLLVSALAASTTPLGAANREHEQLMADIRMLQEQNQRLQLALVALADTLKTVTTRLDEQAAATRKGFEDQKLLVDNVAGDLRVLREKLDETNVRLTSLSQDVDGLRTQCRNHRSAPPCWARRIRARHRRCQARRDRPR